ncbi:hypothetical protein O0L34_g15372 [Tuta absoluta]|nr:hypothetical protein O0L34_g15372 [Tuta absoluta]
MSGSSSTKPKRFLKDKQIRELKEAQRIPIYKDTVEQLCKYFGIDLKPEWSLSQIRQKFQERTKPHKRTPELRSVLSVKAHLWCRGFFVENCPEWFQMYHLITLMRMMSSFNVNMPTYFVKAVKNRFEIKFLNIEDCRQVFYAMQGIQCFNNRIVIRLEFVFRYKSYDESRTKRAIIRIKHFRGVQPDWCPDDWKTQKVEIHDSDEETREFYEFPATEDIRKDYKISLPDEKVPFEKEAQENLMKISPNTKNYAVPNTSKPALSNIEKVTQVAQSNDNKKEHNVESDPKKDNLIEGSSDTKNVAVPNTRTANIKRVTQVADSNNKEQNVESDPKKDINTTSTTVVVNNIPKSWNNLLINNFIKNAAGHEINFTFSVLNLNSGQYLVKLPTYEDAVKVCKELNGTQVANGKAIVAKLNSAEDVRNECKISHGDEKVQAKDSLMKGSPNTKNVAETNTKNANIKKVTQDSQSNNIKKEQNVESDQEKEIKNTSTTVVVDNIPKSWNNLLINNFIKNAAGHGINFTFSVLNSNTGQYLVKLPTYEDAVKVCKEFDGFQVANGKKIGAKLNSEYDIDEDGRPVKRKLISDTLTTNDEPPKKKILTGK